MEKSIIFNVIIINWFFINFYLISNNYDNTLVMAQMEPITTIQKFNYPLIL